MECTTLKLILILFCLLEVHDEIHYIEISSNDNFKIRSTQWNVLL